MQYDRPVRTVIPGAMGRVLEVLANSDDELTMAQVAELAHLSATHTSQCVRTLVSTGAVERRNIPPTSQLRLSPTDLTAALVRDLNDPYRLATTYLIDSTKTRLGKLVLSALAYGSFARREIAADSDIDVCLVVRPNELDSAEFFEVADAWAQAGSAALGRTISYVTFQPSDIRSGAHRRAPWRSALENHIYLYGVTLRDWKSL